MLKFGLDPVLGADAGDGHPGWVRRDPREPATGALQGEVPDLSPLEATLQTLGVTLGPLSVADPDEAPAHESSEPDTEDALGKRSETWVTIQPSDPMAPGSPEVRYIRRHTRYMVDHGGFARATLTYSWRLAWNLVVVTSLVAVVGFVVGILMAVARRIGSGPYPPDSGDPPTLGDVPWWYWAIMGGMSLLLLCLWGLLASDRRYLELTGATSRAGGGGQGLGGLALALLVFGVGLPFLVLFSWPEVGALGAEVDVNEIWRSLAAVSAGTLAIGALCAGLIGRINASMVKQVGSVARRFSRQLTRLVRVLLLGLGWAAFPLFVGVITILVAGWTYRGATGIEEPSWVWGFMFCVAVCVIASAVGVASWSLHHPYKRLLFTCFGVMRRTTKNGTVESAEGRDPLYEPRLSDAHSSDLPTLVICASANVRDPGASVAGEGALPFVFTPTEIGIPSHRNAMFNTDRLEQALGASRNDKTVVLTLPAAVAISGAAVAPTMGRMTRDPLRALMVAMNLRLGMWLPNPLNAKTYAEVNNPETGVTVRMRPPGLDHLVREVLGRMTSNARWIYVTDGGHTENLGLVELLRRRCDEIWCVDASGDPVGSSATLARAMLMAEGELGVSFNGLDLTRFELDPELTKGPLYRVRHTSISGTFTYADGTGGKLTVLKLGLSQTAPAELIAFQQVDQRFPHHSTLNQVYTAEVFDAYTELGRATAREALSLRK